MKIPTVDIITRHTRDNICLDQVEKSIISSGLLNYKWYVVGNSFHITQNKSFQYLPCDYIQSYHAAGINHYLETIPEQNQWFYVLDDDNLLHPNFCKMFEKADEDCQLIVFSQQLSPSQIRIANPHKLWVQHIDSAQYCVSRRFVQDLKMWNVYRHDGYFIMELVIRAKERGIKIQVFQEVGSFYNAQQWL